MLNAGTLVGHNALGGGDYCRAETLENVRNLVSAGVNTQARLGDAAEALDNGLLAVVLQRHPDDALKAVIDELIGLDVSLVHKNLSDALLHVGGGNVNGVMLGTVGIADAGWILKNSFHPSAAL